MDTKWATTELAWTSHPETGVRVYPYVRIQIRIILFAIHIYMC